MIPDGWGILRNTCDMDVVQYLPDHAGAENCLPFLFDAFVVPDGFLDPEPGRMLLAKPFASNKIQNFARLFAAIDAAGGQRLNEENIYRRGIFHILLLFLLHPVGDSRSSALGHDLRSLMIASGCRFISPLRRILFKYIHRSESSSGTSYMIGGEKAGLTAMKRFPEKVEAKPAVSLNFPADDNRRREMRFLSANDREERNARARSGVS